MNNYKRAGVSFFMIYAIGILHGSANRKRLELEEVDTLYNNRSILIFLDESEAQSNTSGAVSLETAQALCQNAGPLVVSRAVLYNILKDVSPATAPYGGDLLLRWTIRQLWGISLGSCKKRRSSTVP